jgi:hypothetical protein
MSELDWLACADPNEMLNFLASEVACLVDEEPPDRRERLRQHLVHVTGQRKKALFGLGCCRQVWPLLADRRSREAIELTEFYLDGSVSVERWMTAVAEAEAAHHALETGPRRPRREDARAARSAAYAAMRAVNLDARAAADESAIAACWASIFPSPVEATAAQAALLRDIMGNPFQALPRIEPSWLAWNGGLVPRLAEEAYERRIAPLGNLDGTCLAVMADALEDAGCADTDLLGHLRSPGPHVRGCWPVDLILDKT